MRKTHIKKIFLTFVLINYFISISLPNFSIKGYQEIPYPTDLKNGGFETNPKSNDTTKRSYQFDQANLNNWLTTASDNLIEVWRSDFKPVTGPSVTSKSGNYHAEINATMPASLYQDIATDPKSLYKWVVWHKGRSGTDVAQLELGDPLNTAAVNDIDGKNTISDGMTAWGLHEGYYTPLTQVTRFKLKAISTYDNLDAQGNFVDDLDFFKAADPTVQTIILGDPIPDSSDLAVIYSPAVLTPSYASPSEYAEDDEMTPPDLSIPGTYLVKVRLTDGNGKLAGYVNSTIIVKTALTIHNVNENNADLVPPTTICRLQNYSLTLNYLDDQGNPLKPSDISTLYNNDPYSVTNPSEIIINGKVYYVITIVGDPLEGIANEDKAINFILNIKPQTITVNYLDENENPLQPSDIQNLNNQDPYFVTNPGEITIDGKAYEVITALGDPLEGNANTDKLINFILKLKPQTVTINYLNENGKPLKSPDIQSLSNQDPYFVSNHSEITIDGKIYYVITTIGDLLEGIANEDKAISFILKLRPQTITINYLDEDGNVMQSPNIQNLNNQDPYFVSDPGEITIDGKIYEVITATGDPLEGIASGDKVVNFILNIKPQTITINYLDEDRNPLQSPNVNRINISDPYFVAEPEEVIIDGKTYNLIATEGDPLEGNADTDKIVDFILKPETQIIKINYIDEDGNILEPPKIINLENNDPYNITKSNEIFINGNLYEVIGLTGDPLNGIADTDKNIIYKLGLKNVLPSTGEYIDFFFILFK